MKVETPFARPIIIGVLNITPDSFSDGGYYLDERRAIQRAEELLEGGADVIEIGGESTRPGSTPISTDDEWKRIGSIVSSLARRCTLSIDTYKSDIARRALDHGAKMINDVSAFRADSNLAPTIAQYDAFAAVMYSKESGLPHVTEMEPVYDDIVGEIRQFLAGRIEHATSAGIRRERIIVDPGLGRFLGSDPELSWTVLRELSRLRDLGAPILVGTSRKGFLGGSLTDRDPLSQLSALGAWLNGADLIRTHDARMAQTFFDCWNRIQSTSERSA